MGPEHGTCHKLGFIFLILFIALLRMAHILLYPIIDPTQALPIITRASTFIIANSEAWIFNAVRNFSISTWFVSARLSHCYGIVEDFITSFLPLFFIYMGIYFGSSFFYLVHSIEYWIYYI